MMKTSIMNMKVPFKNFQNSLYLNIHFKVVHIDNRSLSGENTPGISKIYTLLSVHSSILERTRSVCMYATPLRTTVSPARGALLPQLGHSASTLP